MIRRDGIDILVDLAGHTGGNRLPMFARKPAPIQASYLGYLGTTGLTAMDYYLTDAHADPPGLAEVQYLEQLVRLPECGFCYHPGPAPEVSTGLPVRHTGKVSFGCLNNLAKVSDEVLDDLVANSGGRVRLSALAPHWGRPFCGRADASASSPAMASRRTGCSSSVEWRRGADYLKLYHDVDIALDPFPTTA